ncbi:hypothetical protein DSO57_1002331 [Entomophthora muscae]|uniref:Uncharacterized protein n=1 Tax=Entomophthora muscae TaxID=34485 RepID=A0ACC2UIH4_9FUNG|nr:hypothetical protein DSO57_1002331 [Entomophthora muscae]
MKRFQENLLKEDSLEIVSGFRTGGFFFRKEATRLKSDAALASIWFWTTCVKELFKNLDIKDFGFGFIGLCAVRLYYLVSLQRPCQQAFSYKYQDFQVEKENPTRQSCVRPGLEIAQMRFKCPLAKKVEAVQKIFNRHNTKPKSMYNLQSGCPEKEPLIPSGNSVGQTTSKAEENTQDARSTLIRDDFDCPMGVVFYF